MAKKNVKTESNSVRTVIQEEVKQATRDYIWSTIKFSIAFLLLFYIGLSIYSSQAISPLYFSFITESKQSAADVLKSIRILPQFDQLLTMQRNIFGPEIDDLVFGEETQRSSTIERLETLLQKNPYSRDVLYGLYLLHKEKGEQDKAMGYLKRAQEIDPRIK